MAHDLFISYSHKDKPAADAACATLEGRGIRCWIAPRDIAPGEDWGEAIIEAINNARVMVLVFSAHANESAQIKREVERAVAKGIAIIPLRIEDVLPTRSLEYFLSTPHWLDAFTPPLERHLNYLADVVGQILVGKPYEGLRAPAARSPLSVPFYRRREVLLGGGAATVALASVAGWALLRPSAPPSLVGKWQSTKSNLNPASETASTFGPGSTPLSELVNGAFQGAGVTAGFEVTPTGQYSLSEVVADHGTFAVTSGDNVTLTSASSHSSVTARVTLSAPSIAGNLSRIGGKPGDSWMIWETPKWQLEFAGKPIKGIAGAWHSATMMAMQFWQVDLNLASDATYTLKFSRSERGLFQFADGKWKANPSDGPPTSGTYRFAEADTVEIVWNVGSIVFVRAT